MRLTAEIKAALFCHGIESFHNPALANITDLAEFEPPCSIKWLSLVGRFRIGAFSYGVSGYVQDTVIGRYVSMGEDVQVGRANHSTDWLSTSPFFYLREKMFNVGSDFLGGEQYHAFKPDPCPRDRPPTVAKVIQIGNDVWIGHGAFIMPGVKIGDGAVIAAGAIVTKDVPPYAVMAGVPATVKKFRHDEKTIEALLELRWWRFAPWDLKGLPSWDPQAFIAEFRKKERSLSEYRGQTLSLSALAATKAAP